MALPSKFANPEMNTYPESLFVEKSSTPCLHRLLLIQHETCPQCVQKAHMTAMSGRGRKTMQNSKHVRYWISGDAAYEFSYSMMMAWTKAQ